MAHCLSQWDIKFQFYQTSNILEQETCATLSITMPVYYLAAGDQCSQGLSLSPTTHHSKTGLCCGSYGLQRFCTQRSSVWRTYQESPGMCQFTDL